MRINIEIDSTGCTVNIMHGHENRKWRWNNCSFGLDENACKPEYAPFMRWMESNFGDDFITALDDLRLCSPLLDLVREVFKFEVEHETD